MENETTSHGRLEAVECERRVKKVFRSNWWFHVILFLLSFLLQPLPALSSSQSPFPGNNGQSGLWDMPNARVMPDWHMRLNFAYADPYRYFGATIGLLDRFEFNGRITEITTLGGLPGQRHARDKAIDLKFLLFKEREWLPAMAVGATDVHGTGLFTSRYLVFSKILKPFDLTLGLGQGILAGETTTGRSEDSAIDFLLSRSLETRVFGGVEFHVTEDLSLVGEYSSFDYEVLTGSSKATWPVNLGLKYRLAENFLTSLSWQKGEELSFGLSLTFPFEPEGLLPWKKRPFYRPPEKARLDAYLAENEALAFLVADQVSKAGFENVSAAVKNDALWVEFANNLFLSNQKALGRVARVADLTAPPRIDWLYLALIKQGMVVYTFKVHRTVLRAFLETRLDDRLTWENSEHYMGGRKLWLEFVNKDNNRTLTKAPKGHQKLKVHLIPRVESLLNDPSGFYKASINTHFTAGYRPWKGALFTSSLRVVLYNNISTSNVVEEPEPTRTDFVDYLADRNPRLVTLAYDQIFKLPGDVWARTAVGAFESAYMGVGGELFRFFGDGRFGAGVESEVVRKRDIDDQFKVKEGSPTYYTGFLNLSYHLWPSQGIDLGLKVGRFLAGDKGVRMDVSRTFKYFTLGAWLTVTDTSVFSADINRGYEDKGIYLSIPLSLFLDSDLPGRLHYSITPWTRDQGQLVAQPRHLYRIADEGNLLPMRYQLNEMLQ